MQPIAIIMSLLRAPTQIDITKCGLLILVITSLIDLCHSVSCYKCESYRDYRCLDPFDYQPHIQVNCDFEPFVRDRKPVFCEKTTDLIDGVYVTTRGCSSFQWEDVDAYVDHRNQNMRCFRRGLLERCLCQFDGCNASFRPEAATSVTLLVFLLTIGVGYCL